MDHIDNNMPDMHQQLKKLIEQSSVQAETLSLEAEPNPNEAMIIVRKLRKDIKDSLVGNPFEFPSGEAEDLSMKIVSSLIGECSMDWR